MSTLYSDQMTLVADLPSLMISHRDVGKGKIYRFQYTVATGNNVAADVIQLQTIQDYGYYLMGLYWASAMSSAGGDSSVSVGLLPIASRTPNHGLAALVAGTHVPAYFLGTTSVDAATSAVSFGATRALGNDTLLYPGDIVTMTVVTEAWIAAGVVHGYFMTT